MGLMGVPLNKVSPKAKVLCVPSILLEPMFERATIICEAHAYLPRICLNLLSVFITQPKPAHSPEDPDAFTHRVIYILLVQMDEGSVQFRATV